MTAPRAARGRTGSEPNGRPEPNGNRRLAETRPAETRPAVQGGYDDALASPGGFGDALATPGGFGDALASPRGFADALASTDGAGGGDALAGSTGFGDALAFDAFASDALSSDSLSSDALGGLVGGSSGGLFGGGTGDALGGTDLGSSLGSSLGPVLDAGQVLRDVLAVGDTDATTGLRSGAGVERPAGDGTQPRQPAPADNANAAVRPAPPAQAGGPPRRRTPPKRRDAREAQRRQSYPPPTGGPVPLPPARAGWPTATAETAQWRRPPARHARGRRGALTDLIATLTENDPSRTGQSGSDAVAEIAARLREEARRRRER